jgi:hypothetical protein
MRDAGDFGRVGHAWRVSIIVSAWVAVRCGGADWGATSGSSIRASYVPVSCSYLSLWKVLTFIRDAFAGQDSLVAFLRSGVPFGHAGTVTMLLDWLLRGEDRAVHRTDKTVGQTRSDQRFWWWPGVGRTADLPLLRPKMSVRGGSPAPNPCSGEGRSVPCRSLIQEVVLANPEHWAGAASQRYIPTAAGYQVTASGSADPSVQL